MSVLPLEDWPDRLERAFLACNGLFKRVTVLRETASTQDAARRQNARPGDVVTAWRQTAGRGRLGRAWADTGEQGVAMTCVVEAGPSERLSCMAAVGMAIGVESVLKRAVEIKWPNDIMIDGRKLAGILVEQHDGCAFVGVGINVDQTDWPAEIAKRAISLRQSGIEVDRIEVIVSILKGLSEAWWMDELAMTAAYGRRNSLVGCTGTFRLSGELIRGQVLQIHPVRGLLVQQGSRERWLPSALTSVVHDMPVSGR